MTTKCPPCCPNASAWQTCTRAIAPRWNRRMCVECAVHVRCSTHHTAAEAAAAAVRHCPHLPGFVPVLCIQHRLNARVVGWVTNNWFYFIVRLISQISLFCLILSESGLCDPVLVPESHTWKLKLCASNCAHSSLNWLGTWAHSSNKVPLCAERKKKEGWMPHGHELTHQKQRECKCHSMCSAAAQVISKFNF